MNPNYFYDLAYVSPYGAQMYEYSQHDTENRVDFATFYNEDMWTRGLLTDDSRTLLDTYHAIPKNGYPNTKLGLEWDCGSVKPALFARLHATDGELNTTIYNSVATVVGLQNTTQPVLPTDIQAEDIGIYPERANGIVRYLVRGTTSALKQFSINNGITDTGVFDTLSGATIWNTGVSFDWNGATLNNFTLHSSELLRNNAWVIESKQHCESRVAALLQGTKYSLSQFVKIGLSDNYSDDYLKAYFTVRTQR
jgi:hypothetical protein